MPRSWRALPRYVNHKWCLIFLSACYKFFVLFQVLNFTDLDCLSLSNIEEPQDEVGEQPESLLESMMVLATSTPTPSSAKLASNRNMKRSGQKDENSLNTSGKPPLNSPTRLRVPLGNVNRPSLVTASPRLHLQNKQKQTIRNELLQGRVKSD